MIGPRQLVQPDPDQRALLCRRQNACLDLAARANWRGWSCTGCTAYEVMTALEQRADLEALAGLLGAIGEQTVGQALRAMNRR